jgi:hypothetical protein
MHEVEVTVSLVVGRGNDLYSSGGDPEPYLPLLNGVLRAQKLKIEFKTPHL